MLFQLQEVAKLIKMIMKQLYLNFFFFQAEDGIRDGRVTGVQTCALPIYNNLHVSAQLLDVNALRLSQPLVQDGPLDHMLDVLDSLAWHVARGLDPKFPLPEGSFQAAGASLHLNGFENYIRGIVETEPAERIRHLKIAVAENPAYSPAWLALGMTYFSEQQFDASAAALGHLRKTDRAALEAEFYRGLAFFYTGHYDEAEEA